MAVSSLLIFELLSTEPTRPIPDCVLIAMDLHKWGGNQFWQTLERPIAERKC